MKAAEGFQAASRLYAIAEKYHFSRCRIQDDLFARYSKEFVTLKRELGDDRLDPYWDNILARFSRCRFEFSGYPLPFNHPAYKPDETGEYLLSWLSDCDRIFPAHAERAGLVLNLLLSLLQRSDNPIGDRLETALSTYSEGDAGLLMLRGRHRMAVEDYLKARGLAARCVDPGDLSQTTTFETLAIVGPLRWFRSSVLSAPRASNIEVFTYEWISDKQPALDLLSDSRSAVSQGLNSHSVENAIESRANDVDADEIVPATPWLAISRRLSDRETAYDSSTSVPSFAFLLAQDSVVFLEAEYGAKSSILDISGDAERIQRIPNADIQPGMFLLLRSQGGGDYIAIVANTLLGPRAAPLREKQELWKRRLRGKISEVGISTVAADLKRFGSQIADEQNVRNWASAHSLKTWDRRDFGAIMLYVGLGKEAADFWDSMETLDSAHRRAGARIRAQLLALVESTDLSVLESEGRINFVLPESEGGSFSGFRVEERSPQTISVPTTRLGRPLRMEVDLWRE